MQGGLDGSLPPALAQGGSPLEELRRTRERVERILQVVVGSDGVTVLDFTGRLVHANATAARILGFASTAELLRTPTGDVLARLDIRDASGEHVVHELPGRALFRGEPPSEQTLRITAPGVSEATWAVVRAVPLVDEENRIIAVVNIFRDITAQKRAERRLRLLADASAALATSLRPAAVLEALRGLLVPALGDWCSVDATPGEATGRPIAASPQPRLLSAVDDFVLERVASGPEELAALRALAPRSLLVVPFPSRTAPEGRIVLLGGRGRPAYGPEELALLQELAARASVAFDNAWLHERVLQEDRRKDEFIAVLGHELRNPLHPIFAALELMRTRGGDAAYVAAKRDVIHRQARQMSRLIDDLLDVSRIARGKVELRKEPLDVNAAVRRAVDSTRPQVDARGHALEVALAPGELWVEADPLRIEQAVINLLTNAAKYMAPGGRIWLSTAREAGEVAVRVRDAGVGLDAADLERVFEPFTQVAGSRELAQGGLGIGLSLVKGFIALHGGQVEAASPGRGHGAEFTVRLPALALMVLPVAADVVEAAPAVVPPPSPAFRVLVVDDNREGADLLAEYLQATGYEVLTAYDAHAALELAARHEVGAALLDIGLPEMDGYALAQHLRARPGGERLFLAALTGFGQESARAQAMEAGFDLHLTKPVAAYQLLAALSQARERA